MPFNTIQTKNQFTKATKKETTQQKRRDLQDRQVFTSWGCTPGWRGIYFINPQ